MTEITQMLDSLKRIEALLESLHTSLNPRLSLQFHGNSPMKPLNRWAKLAGYASFNVYICLGGSLDDARHDIHKKIAALEDALFALSQYRGKPTDNPITDQNNAQIQGDDDC